MVLGAALLILTGCPDDNGDGGGTNGTERAYTCANGTAVDGTTTNSNTERCSTCTDPYDLNSDTRTCQPVFTCANGQAAPGFATGSSALERCTECSFSYHLDQNTHTCNLILESTFNITDMEDLEINGARGVTTAVVGTTTYLFVTGDADNGISVFSVANDGTLASVHNESVGTSPGLGGAAGVITAVVGTTTYLFVAGSQGSGVSVFRVEANGALTSVHNESDAGDLLLDAATGVTTAVVGSTTYLFVAGQNDNGVSVFRVETNGALTSVHNESDAGALELSGATGVTTAVVGSTTYLFVTGLADRGVSVFSIANDGTLASVHNIDDTTGSTGGITLELAGATGITTAVVGTTTYLFVAGQDDNGVSVFSVADDGNLTSVHNESDAGDLLLNGAAGVTTAVVGSTTYLFVTGINDDGVSVFSVANDGTLASVHNVTDDATLQLNGARGVGTAVVGTTTYLFVAGHADDGVSVFRVQ